MQTYTHLHMIVVHLRNSSGFQACVILNLTALRVDTCARFPTPIWMRMFVCMYVVCLYVYMYIVHACAVYKNTRVRTLTLLFAWLLACSLVSNYTHG